MNELEAVNRILVSAQMQPVASLSSPDRMTSKAQQILTDTSLREQERSWDFNSDYEFELTASAGQFTIPTTPWTVLSLDIQPYNSNGKDIVVRDGKLWDRTNHTFTFAETTIKVDITWAIDFDNCPLVFQEKAVAAACVRFAIEVSVDPQIAAGLVQNKRDAEALLRVRDTAQSSQSIYDRWPLSEVSRRWNTLLGRGRWR